MSDSHPDAPDILQEEAPEPVRMSPVPVVTEGPVRTQGLPAKSGGFRSYDLTTGQAVRILSHDPKRKRALLVAMDSTGTCSAVILGNSQAEGRSSLSALLPMMAGSNSSMQTGTSPVLELTTQDDVWASTLAGTCTITVINEQWAE